LDISSQREEIAGSPAYAVEVDSADAGSQRRRITTLGSLTVAAAVVELNPSTEMLSA